jgi:SAM-dependent methyltransferase
MGHTDPREAITVMTYGRVASLYADHRNPLYWRDELRQFISYVPNGHILDVGCGPGYEGRWLIERGFGYTGIDPCPLMLDIAAERIPEHQLQQSTVYAPNIAEGSCDGAIAICSLSHIPKLRMPEALTSIWLHLKKGGILFLTLLDGVGEGMQRDTFLGRHEWLVSCWTPSEFTQTLTECGFMLLEVSYKADGWEDDTPWVSYYARKAAQSR